MHFTLSTPLTHDKGVSRRRVKPKSAPSKPFFIALIATCNRPLLLKKRALRSIAAQTRRPDLVVVIDDSESRWRRRNRAAVEDFIAQTGVQTVYISNRRCRGASGAWNSGVLAVLGRFADSTIERVYVAILDDDDEWLPCHLAQSQAAIMTAGKKRADFLAATFERREGKQRCVITPPAKLNGCDFLRGNPGVGGSMLIIRLPIFLRAGMFDESLPACTDRDLCFRLSLLPRLVYLPLSQLSVIHYAETNRTRLSNKNYAVKHAALRRFADKYRGWMSAADYAVFCQRAEELFGWQPAEKPHVSKCAVPARPPAKEKSQEKIALIIGIIINPHQFPDELFGDILRLTKDTRLVSLDVVVIPSSDSCRRTMHTKIAHWRRLGLRLYCINSTVPKPLADFLQVTGGQRPIAINRTILQHAMSRIAIHLRNPVCWILDGDNRLSALKARNGRIVSFCPDYIGEMNRLRASGCDAAIGGICGAAPLPRAFTVRTQMVDLLHILGRLLAGQGRHCLPRQTIVATAANIAENYHHDCLPHPHLEQPVGVLPAAQTRSLSLFLRDLPAMLERLLAGEAVTRPLLAATSAPIQRGGNTLVFNSELLSHCPNGFARGQFADMRRQDEMWRVVNEKAFQCNIVSGCFPVTQCRGGEPAAALDISRLVQDIAGQAVVKAFDNAAGKPCRGVEQMVAQVLNSDFYQRVQENADERLGALCASFYRIVGIAAGMRSLIGSAGEGVRGEAGKDAIAVLRKIERRFSPTAFEKITQQVHKLLDDAALRQTLHDFPADCRDFSAMKDVWEAWLRREKKENALVLLSRYVLNVPLRFLGCGGEGSVFTDERYVFKVLHRWYARAVVADPGFLPLLCKRWKAFNGGLAWIKSANEQGDLILTMPYEKMAFYRGGYGASLTRLLAEIRHNGVVYWDISIKNLRRHGNDVRLIDYGNDVRRFTEHDFDLSVRKAWLCWRWRRGWCKDIRALLSATLYNDKMPELSGYKVMKAAAEQYATRATLPDDAIREVLKYNPKRILDYGCGKGQYAAAFAARGIQVSAYDPNMTAKTAQRLSAAGVHTIAAIELEHNRYDVVLLRLVICEMPSEAALRQCLNTVRRLLSADGRVVVIACNLTELVKETALARHWFPRSACIARKFFYRKQIRITGNVHAHVHRPENMLLREFSRAGLQVVERRTFDEINIERFELGGSGTTRWTLQPLQPLPSTALIIRACAMDAHDAEAQVRQLVERLNFPRGFAEIILTMDSGTDSFLRQHTAGDLQLLHAVALRLRQEGWIDRIVYAPNSAVEIRSLNRRWLGVDTAASHAANGAPLSVVFAAFAVCRHRYALHIDIDMLIGREHPDHDYLGAMLAAMKQHDALTMALNVPGAQSPITQNPTCPHRLEVRAGLTDLKRLKQNLPLPIEWVNELPAVGWHRAADSLIARCNLPSLRGGNQKLFAVHPPNEYKHCLDAIDIITNAAAAAPADGAYARQRWRNNEWNGKEGAWLPAPRREKFIFIVCGRNVSTGKINRCLDSIICQRRQEWGVVIIDDASHGLCTMQLRQWARSYPARMTLFCRRRQMGGLANLIFAIRRLCDNPKSIIITLDLDDALLSESVLCRLHDSYRRGADVTVGSMLRTDKQADYPVDFLNPSVKRGGNVWQHLRSFRKSLFDAIPDSALRDNDGSYYDLAADWAYMLPIVEMAAHPMWIRQPLYLYEPDVVSKRQQRAEREKIIARIVSRPALAQEKGRNK